MGRLYASNEMFVAEVAGYAVKGGKSVLAV